jgi:hypothetical protein
MLFGERTGATPASLASTRLALGVARGMMWRRWLRLVGRGLVGGSGEKSRAGTME